MRFVPASAFSIVAVVMCAANAQAQAPEGNANATVQQPRPFGYVVGDLLTQRVLLQLEGREFEPASLPAAARLGVWLERRAPRVENAHDGRRWLSIDYQVINAPQALTSISLPAWELKPKAGATTLRIATWPISIAPLTPREVFAKGDLEELRSDRPAPVIPTERMRRQIAIWSAALAATLAAWVGWFLWRNWRARSTQPFARALREVSRVGDASPEAWLALHRAFDRSAGIATQSATLEILFQRAPHLAPLRSGIEQFFAESGELFFGAGLPANAISVRGLCTQLRRAEKRHEQ
jgi:mxaA protein